MTNVIRTEAAVRRHRPTRAARARLAAVPETEEGASLERPPMPAGARKRLKDGEPRPGDLTAFRSMLGLSQPAFARALGVQVATWRNWEQGRRKPDGAAIALLRLAARHPRLLLESLALAG